MTFPHGWPGSPPRSAPPPHPSHPSNTDGQDHPNIYLMLGRLIGGQDHVIYRLDKIDGRLEAGSEKMDQHDDRLTALETAEMRADHIPRWERVLKRWLAYLIPLGVFAGTGQLAAALEWAKVLK